MIRSLSAETGTPCDNMNTGEEDTTTFYRLVKRQRARPSTDKGCLRYDGDVLGGAE